MLKDEIENLIKASNSSLFEVSYMDEAYHSHPENMRVYLQEEIDNDRKADKIVVCASKCGGGTSRLRARHADLIIPKTRDCIDILLSNEKTSLKDLYRPYKGIFYTASWVEYMKKTKLDLKTFRAKKGRAEADKIYKEIYEGFNNFYIIDTGCFNVLDLEDYLQPALRLLGGKLDIIEGRCGIIRKIATCNFDEDFHVIKPGQTSPYVPSYQEYGEGDRDF